jgi:hypothetical protein
MVRTDSLIEIVLVGGYVREVKSGSYMLCIYSLHFIAAATTSINTSPYSLYGGGLEERSVNLRSGRKYLTLMTMSLAPIYMRSYQLLWRLTTVLT